MWKIVEVSKVSVLYIYIYIYIDNNNNNKRRRRGKATFQSPLQERQNWEFYAPNSICNMIGQSVLF